MQQPQDHVDHNRVYSAILPFLPVPMVDLQITWATIQRHCRKIRGIEIEKARYTRLKFTAMNDGLIDLVHLLDQLLNSVSWLLFLLETELPLYLEFSPTLWIKLRSHEDVYALYRVSRVSPPSRDYFFRAGSEPRTNADARHLIFLEMVVLGDVIKFGPAVNDFDPDAWYVLHIEDDGHPVEELLGPHDGGRGGGDGGRGLGGGRGGGRGRGGGGRGRGGGGRGRGAVVGVATMVVEVKP